MRVPSARTAPGLGTSHRVLAEIGQAEIAQQQAAVGVRIRAHAAIAFGRQFGQFGNQPAGVIEQLFGLVASHPLFENREMLGLGAHLAERHLVGAPRVFDGHAVHFLGAGPAFGLRSTIIGHADVRRTVGPAARADSLNTVDLFEHAIHGSGHELVHRLGLVAFHIVRRVAVAGEQMRELLLRDAGQDRRVRDLVSVEMQDGQDSAIARRIEELVRMPTGSQRAGLGFAIADNAAGDKTGIIEYRAMRVQHRVAKLAAFVDRAGRFRRHVAGDAARKRELREEALHPLDVLPDIGVELAVRPFEISVRHHARAAMSGAGDIDHVEIVLPNDAVAVRVDEVEARRGSPVAKQPRLDVLGLERLAE